MKSESNTKEPILPMPASMSANGGGADSCSKSKGTSKALPFLWKDCANLVQRDRVDIKQQAVLDGLRLGERLSSIFKSRIDGEKQGLGAEELADWAEKFHEAKELYEAPHSTIGFIGAIGAGKSTIINALLGEQDFLPSSHDGAGTGAACKVHYNRGPDGYRAEFKFRSRQGFTDELDELYRNLEARKGLMARMEEDPDTADEQEIEDQLEDIKANTTETLQTLGVIFGGAKEDYLGVTSTEEFFNAHPFELLGTTVNIIDTDREAFVSKTKPYMASTPPCISEGQELVLWPLIEHATLFVNSEILKYGLELVDLPGLGDDVQCRSRVAQRFSQHLDITVIVAPPIRVTEEKAVVGFIKKRQECEMRMNGKFNRNGLCVVLSKSEDMDHNVYLGSKRIAQDYPNIPEHLARAKSLDKTIRKADSQLNRSEPEKNGDDTTGGASIDGEVHTNRQNFLALSDSLKRAAVSIRNRYVSESIKKKFQGKHAAIQSSKDDQSYADAVKDFPTSARAFQAIRHPGSVMEAGFPTERHTGIPRLKQWLFEVTFQKREEHLDAILNMLSGLFVRIQTWISVNEHATVVPATGLHDIQSIHEWHRQSLTTSLRQFGDELRQIEPLKEKGAAIVACQRQYRHKIDCWRFTYPDKADPFPKLYASTQRSIIRKNGDLHKSTGRFAYEYQWVDDLAAVFIDQIVNGWKHAFLEVVPSYETKIQESLGHEWQRYMIALNKFCGEHNVSHLGDTGKVQQAIDNAEAHLEFGARTTLASFRIGAQSVHPHFRKEIKKILTTVFQKAYEITGAGSVSRRNELLKNFAASNAAEMPVKACEAMEAALAELIQRHIEELEGLADGAVLMVERQMKLLLGINKASISPSARANQKILTADISPHLASWKLCWQKPSSQREDHVMRGDLSIPDAELINVKAGEIGV